MRPSNGCELLPGETVEGEYEFSVKNGVKPLQILLKPLSQTQACDGTKGHFVWRDEVKLDLINPVSNPSQEMSTSAAQQPTTAQLRVFLTSTKAGKDDATAIKALHDHCPQVQVTTEKEKAGYVIKLSPKSFKQSKNAVTVTSKAGDVVYVGSTFSLSNAMKDACAAMLKDVNAAGTSSR